MGNEGRHQRGIRFVRFVFSPSEGLLESENTCMTACARRRPSGREGTRAGSAAVAVSTARDGRDGRTDERTRGAGRDRVAPPSRDPPASWPPWCPRGPVSSLLEERRFFRLSGSRTRRGVPKPRASPSRSSRVRPRARDRALLAREQTGGPSRGDLRSRAARCVHDEPRRRWNERSTCDWIFARSTASIDRSDGPFAFWCPFERPRPARGGDARVSAHNETRGIHRTPRHRTRGHRAGEPTPRERRARRGTRRRRTARAREIVRNRTRPGGALASHSDAMLKKQQQAVGGFVPAARRRRRRC